MRAISNEPQLQSRLRQKNAQYFAIRRQILKFYRTFCARHFQYKKIQTAELSPLSQAAISKPTKNRFFGQFALFCQKASKTYAPRRLDA